MNRSRGPQFGAVSKATPQTLCQKCLKRGHYSYECKASAQDRPYASRPSRTQQLANPKLIPKLTSDVPNTLLRKTGIADEQLAKREEERGRKRSASPDEIDGPRKRSRSSSSFTSVSTISTNRSRSISPRPSRSRDRDNYYTSQQDRLPLPSYGTTRTLKRRRRTRSPSLSYSSDSSTGGRKATKAGDVDRNTRRRHNSTSPNERGRRHDAGATHYSRRTRSRSMDRSRIARDRRSMTPAMGEGDRGRRNANPMSQKEDTAAEDDRRYPNNGDRNRRGYGTQGSPPLNGRQGAGPLPPRKERSLSPFSKRLALTQAMNMGR